MAKELTRQLIEAIRPILVAERAQVIQNEIDDLPPTFATVAAIKRKEEMEQDYKKGLEIGRERTIVLSILKEDFAVDFIAEISGLDV